jgi:hypothetical protein
VSYFDQSPISQCAAKQIDRDSDSLPADLFLGVTIAGVSTLIGIGLIIVFA